MARGDGFNPGLDQVVGQVGAPKLQIPLAAAARDLERRIESLETRLGEIDTELSRPEIYSDGDMVRDLARKRAEVEAELQPLGVEWARRAEVS